MAFQLSITGLVGQISLAQLTFAGVGAFAAAKFASTLGIPFIWTVLLSGLNQRAGRLAHGPARASHTRDQPRGRHAWRRGCHQQRGVQQPPVAGGILGLGVPQPEIFGWSLNSNTHPERFAGAAAIILAVMYLLMVAIRKGRLGRQLLAVRDNERSAAGTGVDVRAMKLGAFALAAFMAGVAGALYAYQNTNITFDAFSPIAGIFFFATVYIAGIASLGGGLLVWLLASGGIMWTWLAHFSSLTTWQDLLAGAGLLLTVVQNPDGVVPRVSEQISGLAKWIRSGRGTVAAASSSGSGSTSNHGHVEVAVVGPGTKADTEHE